MICERCKAQLTQWEGQFIIWNAKNVCVCRKCFEDIRKENIELLENNTVSG